MNMDPELLKHLLGGDRFTVINGYKFDKLIFAGFTFVILIFFVAIFLFYGADRQYHVYYKCTADGLKDPYCVSPLYANYPMCESAWETACDDLIVPAGFEYGEKPPAVIHYFGFIIAILFAGALVINHLLYNQGKRFDTGDET